MDNLTKIIFDRLHFKTNQGKSFTHPLDKDGTKALLKELYNDGKQLNIAEFTQLAIDNQWEQSAIDLVLQTAEKLANGKTIQCPHGTSYAKDMYQRIKNGEFN